MNFTLLPSSSVLIHSSSGISVSPQARPVSCGPLSSDTVSPSCFHRGIFPNCHAYLVGLVNFSAKPYPSRFLTSLQPVAQGSLSNRSASGQDCPILDQGSGGWFPS